MRISLQEAAARLQNGEVVAIPTETVYGLAADATNDIALQKIFTTKQRPADHPLIVHIGDISQVAEWATDFPEVAVKLAKTFWPGALTLILPAKNDVSPVVRAGEPTIALRVPNHPLTLELLRISKLSVAAPSANKFTQLSPTTAAHVEEGLGDNIPVLDGGACQVGIESTIVSVTTDGQWQLLRPGMISEADIAKIAGQPQRKTVVEQSMDKANTVALTPKAPGQHALHYSPRTPMLLFKDRATLIETSVQLINTGKTCVALIIGDGIKPSCYISQLANQPREVAAQLYGALHQLDSLKVDSLLVELPPDTPEWAAVLDRLSRAGFSKAN
ncbi:MAG: L-threonylcarbamoyladenylate synthase [Methylotenera sp.]|uniref:L-threonylcarbamoyladenylate synthase n=1 Tax=Methylotenera sp. TaxID=2051956 RepID=UPI002487F023|nr:L-threonylcarbamoyladenylate synthase [Methylotenera sp.]MDI1308808.1 L-threonylcarbamoyladenylate synthase [Methylotenera sp.]